MKDYGKWKFPAMLQKHSMAEVGNDAKLIQLFINNLKIANCDGYAKMMLVNSKRYFGLVAQVAQYG